MKKFFALFLSFSLLLSLLPLFGEGEVVELKVYNWEDYISIDDGSGESVDLIKGEQVIVRFPIVVAHVPSLHASLEHRRIMRYPVFDQHPVQVLRRHHAPVGSTEQPHAIILFDWLEQRLEVGDALRNHLVNPFDGQRSHVVFLDALIERSVLVHSLEVRRMHMELHVMSAFYRLAQLRLNLRHMIIITSGLVSIPLEA